MFEFRNVLDFGNSAVLIHGRHVGALGWDNIEFGDMSHLGSKVGQVPRGLEIARVLGVKHLIFGTGASEKDGLFEAEYILREAERRAKDVVSYLNTRLLAKDRFTEDEYLAWLDEISFCEIQSQNTVEEVGFTSEYCQEHGVKVLWQVSSPSHLMRCIADWIKHREANQDDMIVLPVPSDTFYEGAGPNDTVIVEYPHRGDAPLYATYQYVQRIFRIMGQGEQTFISFLEDFGRLLEKYQVDMTGVTPLLK